MKKIEEFIESTFEDYPSVALISILYREHMKYLNHELAKIQGLNISSGQVLFIIELLKGEITQEALANKLDINPGTVTRAMNKLEEEKLITRTVDENNRRRYNISLTSSGRLAASKIKKIDANWEKNIYSSLSKGEKEKFVKNLKKITIKSIGFENK
jgi:DNA-binding MarR family transcriptional regulator